MANYARDKEKILAQQKARYDSDPDFAERKRQTARDWYAAHKDDPEVKARRNAQNEMWKVKAREKYLAGRKRRRDRDRQDPQKNLELREKSYAMWRRRTDELVAIANEVKSAGCIYCGETNVECLDFHHRDGEIKSFTIGKALQRSTPLKTLLRDIAKCDIVCPNCHKEHHPPRFIDNKTRPERLTTAQRQRQKRVDRWGSFIERCKFDGCTLCDAHHHPSLDFHHVDPSQKSFKVGDYRVMALSVDVPGEVVKCMVLCANCHRLHHKGLV